MKDTISPVSQKQNNLYILDRNATSTILKIANKNIPIGNKNAERLNVLKEIDKPENIISTFASVLEGINPHSNNFQNSENQLSKEIQSVKTFFRFAKTDTDIMQQIMPQLAQENFFQSFNSGVQFLLKIASYFREKISPQNCSIINQIQKIIFNNAEMLNIPRMHLVVIFSLSSLYGNDNTLKFLKLNKHQYSEKLAYNAMSDIVYIQFIQTVNDSPNNTTLKVLPLSFDNALMNIYNIFEKCDFRAHTYHENGLPIIDFSWEPLPQKFFPNMTKQQYDSIFIKC